MTPEAVVRWLQAEARDREAAEAVRAVIAERDDLRRELALAAQTKAVQARRIEELEHDAEQAREELARLRPAVDKAHADNERLRWRCRDTLPEWNDLPDEVRRKLAQLGFIYFEDSGSGMLQLWAEVREAMKP